MLEQSFEIADAQRITRINEKSDLAFDTIKFSARLCEYTPTEKCQNKEG